MTGQITTAANSAFRDFSTAGVPATGDHEPVKSEIRNVFAIIQSVIDTLGLALSTQAKYYDTRANLYDDLTPDEDSIGVVGDDPTPEYRGFYQKVGASGTGSWSYIEGLALPASFAEDLQELSDRVDAIENGSVIYDGATNAIETDDYSITFLGGRAFVVDSALYGVEIGAAEGGGDEDLEWSSDKLNTPRWSAFVRNGQLVLSDEELYEFPAYAELQTTGGVDDTHYAWLDDRMQVQSAALREIRTYGLAPYGPGCNTVMGVGQSFMAGSDQTARLEITAGRQLDGVLYSAKMVGDADRHKSTGATYDYFGTLELNPLVDTVVSTTGVGAVVVSDADVATGTFTTSARGATPLPGACITFEHLWRQQQNIDGVDADRFDVAVNVAKGEAALADISTGDSLLRAYDAIEVAASATAVSEPTVTSFRLSAVKERHGQADEQAGTETATYITGHRGYRGDINAKAATEYGQTLRAPWIGTQVSGAYGAIHRKTAMAQLTMALNKGPSAEDYDYFLATPDYPFPHFRDVEAGSGNPNAENAHPTTMGNQMATDYLAWARFFVQVLRRNWFVTHMGEAYHSGSTLIVGFRAMVPPLRVEEVCVSLTMQMIDHYGFDVTDGGSPVEITGVTKVGDLTFRVDCAAPLTAPVVGLAKGDRPNWPSLPGASNIRDSQTLWTLFEQVFEDGYTNIYADEFEDTTDLENIAALLGKQDMGNWAACQFLESQPLPINL